MRKRFNIIDRIMLPLLLLAALSNLVRLSARYDYTSKNWHLVVAHRFPLDAFAFVTFQWVVVALGFAYLLYQAVRIASPQLSAMTATMLVPVLLFACLGGTMTLRDYWRNYIWEPLEGGPGAIAATLFLVVIFASPIAVGALIAWVARQRIKRGRG